ncbi:hypothetical protein [Sphingomonas qomolangmaensis]|uniref:Uncharacterized protein n=1 Tax=Sphingomonas qomolangmaensis TaxID=2918765 RepID=A0ABY5L8I7_9SPHN|nr:hypothetical protein [Sphingomonas qomolangmaensis]UUL82114.1 hypothetical protein NMP03_13110 [Sphingomonas qomolangmaensis]
MRVAGEVLVLRPSFAALVAAEGEPAPMARVDFAEGVAAGGLAAATPVLRVLVGQILAGR